MPRHIEGVRVTESSPTLVERRRAVVEMALRKYDLESLKDGTTFRAYRDFFWRIGIDPTKNRPAAEALIRRILAGKPLPAINSLVDAYNLASIETEIALAAFDSGKVHGTLNMRSAKGGEEFYGIGMAKPLRLTGGEIVIVDSERLVAVYPHRDAQHSRVAFETKSVLLLACGVPSIDKKDLDKALNVATAYIMEACGGAMKAR